MKQKLKYRNAVFTVDCIKPSACEACGHTHSSSKNKGLILQLHHYKYEFKTSEVRKNPSLVLKNTIWVCFPCHQVADGLRRMEDDPVRGKKILALIKQRRWGL